jgi:hypothetical protein
MRLIFKRARSSNYTTYHVVVASAWLEYFCYKETDIASRIFSVFAAKYGTEPGFVLQYVDYLEHLNDDNSKWNGLYVGAYGRLSTVATHSFALANYPDFSCCTRC